MLVISVKASQWGTAWLPYSVYHVVSAIASADWHLCVYLASSSTLFAKGRMRKAGSVLEVLPDCFMYHACLLIWLFGGLVHCLL